VIRFDCPNCGTALQTSAEQAGKRVKCAQCGSVSVVTAPQRPVAELVEDPATTESPATGAAPAQAPVTHETIEAGIINADIAQSGSGCLLLQIIAASLALGIWSKSWWVFGGCLLLMFIITFVKPLAVVLSIALAGAFGAIGAAIGYHAFESTGATVVIGVIAFVLALGGNLAGLEYIRHIK